MGPVAALDNLADRGHPRGAQQLGQLGEMVVLAGGHGRHHERALAGAAGGALSIIGRRRAAVRGGVAGDQLS